MNRSQRRAATKSARFSLSPPAKTPVALCELGFALLRSGQVAEAEKHCRQALTQQPNFADALHLMGVIAIARQQYDHAVEWIAAALQQSPKPEYLLSLGNALQLLGRLDEALKAYDRGVALKPEDAGLWNSMGFVLTKLDRTNEAIRVFQHVVKLSPRHKEAAQICATLLGEAKRFDEAVVYYTLSAEIEPGRAEVYQSRGFCHQRRARYEQAIADYERALQLEPDNAHAQWNLSLISMLMGKFEAGWVGREARWKAMGWVERSFTQPRWRGQKAIAGRTILLHADEGMGDAIQFSRYVPMVAALGARVILEVQPPVHPLLAGLPGLSHSQPRDHPLPEFDLHCPLGSLPLAFQTRIETIPLPVSCLPSIPEMLRDQWERWLGPHDRLRVGLVWSGNQGHANDHNRSTTLRVLFPMLDLDATFVSLQKDPREQDRITLCECANVRDANEHLTDFLATAALVSCLDLVITVDTSVAHLAGTLGCPVWIMLPFEPDYRWLLDRDDSPWYPTARLFRQDETRDYASVVGRLRRELMAMIRARHCEPSWVAQN
jgi:tetratricopeptide (TPR) repeat protein